MNEFYQHSKIPPECEERHYWHKRFGFASWLFLLFGLYAIFTDGGFKAIALSLTVSVGFNLFDAWMNIRHLKWHIKHNERGES